MRALQEELELGNAMPLCPELLQIYSFQRPPASSISRVKVPHPLLPFKDSGQYLFWTPVLNFRVCCENRVNFPCFLNL